MSTRTAVTDWRHLLRRLWRARRAAASSRDDGDTEDASSSVPSPDASLEPAGFPRQISPASPAEPLRFFVIADWGRPTQQIHQLAAAMAARARCLSPQFVLALGDNFYPSGVKSVSDPNWKRCWEDVFLVHKALRVPWRVCLGNHDYDGNPKAQVDFTTSANNPGGLWQCPAENYSFTCPLAGWESAEFFALDTNGCQASLHRRYHGIGEQTRRNVASLQERLAASTATWKLVFGHHPVYSRGARYHSEGRVLGKDYGLASTLVSGGAQAYFCGHEHVFQHFTVDGVEHLGCGAAGVDDHPGFYKGPGGTELPGWTDLDNNGYVEVALTPGSMEASFVNVAGEVIHSVQRSLRASHRPGRMQRRCDKSDTAARSMGSNATTMRKPRR